MRHFEILDEERKSNLSYSVVSKFATLVNNNFTREQISSLIDSLLLNSTNLSSLLKNDDIFEEKNITYALINKLALSYHQTFALEALIQIPIQCINKNVRVALINNLTCESFALIPLLENASFIYCQARPSRATLKQISTNYVRKQ